MGRQKSIIKQVSDRLHSMAAYGQSKHQDKASNHDKPAADKIYSHSTMQNYHQAACDFAHWARSVHGCKDLDTARQYTGEYLQQRINAGLSAWTIRRDAAALAKLYDCQSSDLGATLPTRYRSQITQHSTRDPKGFSEARHQDLAALCRSTGLRRHEVAQLRPEDVQTRTAGSTVVTVRQGKGGKRRTIVALDDTPARLAFAAKIAGKDTIIDHIPNRSPIHAWRRDFAQALYTQLARDVTTLPSSEVYRCRNDMAGRMYDKQAMKAVSVSLGHSRLDVVTNYLK